MTQSERNGKFYHFAYSFLLNKTPDYITKEVIESYLISVPPEENVYSLNNIYKRMLVSVVVKIVVAFFHFFSASFFVFH
ncbi:MAG: hypothetical protein WDA26_08515 [Pusillimonas sp.]